jgi:hypothetical protein
MNDTHFEIISAFLDGESVDPDALALTLAHPAARTLLADFLKLRAATVHDGPALPLSLARLRPTRIVMQSARVPLPVAVMVALLVGAASFVLSERRRVDEQSPPAATRAVSFEPGVDWLTVSGPVGQP